MKLLAIGVSGFDEMLGGIQEGKVILVCSVRDLFMTPGPMLNAP